MSDGSASLADAFTREHHEIDAGIEAYLGDAEGDVEDDVAALQAATHALRRHIFLEERFMFPPLREAGLLMPILVMLREHGELWRRMDTLDDAIASGAGTAALQTQCKQMLELLEAHNAKEEPIVYPQADTALSEFERNQLAQFLAAGTFPDGWTCEQAG